MCYGRKLPWDKCEERRRYCSSLFQRLSETGQTASLPLLSVLAVDEAFIATLSMSIVWQLVFVGHCSLIGLDRYQNLPIPPIPIL